MTTRREYRELYGTEKPETPEEVKHKCHVKYRAGMHPSVKIGGVCVGECPNECLEGMVVCAEHVHKEALLYLVDSLRRELAQTKEELTATKNELATVKRSLTSIENFLAERL